jgi:hypothetical protein
MSEATQRWSALGQGNPHAAAQLLPLVYDELRKLAATGLQGVGASGARRPLCHEP